MSSSFKGLAAYKSRFLKGKNIGVFPKTYTIQAASLEKLETGTDPQVIVSFEEIDEQMACNRTQFNKLCDLLGYDGEKWSGRAVILQGRELTSGTYQGKWTIEILQPEPPENGGEVPF